jgi:hypothetical protein
MEGYLTDVRLPKRAETLPHFLQPSMALSILTRPMVLLGNGFGDESIGPFLAHTSDAQCPGQVCPGIPDSEVGDE